MCITAGGGTSVSVSVNNLINVVARCILRTVASLSPTSTLTPTALNAATLLVAGEPATTCGLLAVQRWRGTVSVWH